MQAFLISVTSSVFGALLYGLLVARNEAKIRRWLVGMPRGWLRRRFVRTFIGAVNGKARESDTRTLNYLFLIYPLSFAIVFSSVESLVRHGVERLKDPVKMEQKLENSAAERIKLAKEGEAMEIPLKVGSYVALAWFYVWFLIISPFRVYRSRFSYELDQLRDYCRALASPSELVELMISERKVNDELTLKDFARVIIRIAQLHNFLEYASPLWIWDEPYHDNVPKRPTGQT